MGPLLLTIGLFAAWSLFGLAALALMRADTTSPRIVLIAPALGTSVAVLPAFVVNQLGAPLEDVTVPLAAALTLTGAAVLAIRRPRLPAAIVPVLVVCAAGLLLAGWPMLDLGWRWLGNGNDDMTTYVLAATRLLHTGFWSSIDVPGFLAGRNYPAAMTVLDLGGERPGSQTMIALVQEVSGRSAAEVYMPLALALHLTGLCAAGALALQATRRWWAAVVAAALLAVAPLATYGFVQQLLPQVWGLALAAALAALSMRPELYRAAGPRVRDLVPIGVLAVGLMFVYVEVVPLFGVAYLAYVAVLAVRGRIELRPALRLWLPVAGILVLVLNVYLLRELRLLLDIQFDNGVQGPRAGVPTYGFLLVPAGLPSIVGLQTISPSATAPALDVSIVVAGVLLAVALVAAAVTAWRGNAASVFLVVSAALGAVLAARGADFGLFKLTMYVQPSLCAAAAAWIAGARRLGVRAAGGLALAGLIALGVSTQDVYVSRSRSPIDVRNASAADQVPAFARIVAAAHGRTLVSGTDNIFLAKLQATAARGHPLRFLSLDPVSRLLTSAYGRIAGAGVRAAGQRVERSGVWRERQFPVGGGAAPARFVEDAGAAAALRAGACELVLPTGTQGVINRRALPEGAPDLVTRPCGGARDLLVFTRSTLGEHYYAPRRRTAVSYYQLEPDFFAPGRTFAGFGRYALFRVLDPAPRVRMVVQVTDSLAADGVNRLPPAAVFGAARAPFPVAGRGSARIFSAPLRPRIVAGQPYLMLDMGRDGRLNPARRTGLQAAYGPRVPLDPRYLTAYVRDVSLVSDTEYTRLRPPAALRSFPADLANPDLQYSGMYEDGWVGERAYAVLAGGADADLVVQGIPPPAGGGGHLVAMVDGRVVGRRALGAGPFTLRVPAPASRAPRRVELRFDEVGALSPADPRPASAHLSFLGFAPRTGR